MLPNWLYGKSKSKLASILGGGGTPADYDEVKAQVTQNAEDILTLSDALDGKAALTQITNPNLLDNPWFTVNQRGESSYVGSSTRIYTFDRWHIGAYSADITVALNNDGTITISNTGSNDNLQFAQLLESAILISDKTYNLTCDVVAYTGTVRMLLAGNISPYPSIINKLVDKTGYVSSNGVYDGTSSTYKVAFSLNANSSITIRAVKLELGSVSTLAMDAAPNYATELLKCQRYFIGGKLESLYAYKTLGRVNAFMLLPVTMRSAPVIVGTAGIYALDDNSAVTGASIESPLELYSNGVKFPISGANDTLCRVFIASGSGLSADL